MKRTLTNLDLIQTKVDIFVPDRATPKSTEALSTVSFQLVHIRDAKTSTYSVEKKQCDLWEYVWGSSLVLSGVLCCLDLSGVRALEIGGGHGLCSLAAARSGSNVLMTDIVKDAIELCELNAERNNLDANLKVSQLDWNKISSIPNEEYDLVFAADVLFFRGCIKPVARAFHRAMKPGGIALVADFCCYNHEDFLDALLSLNLEVAMHAVRTDLLNQYKLQTAKKKSFLKPNKCNVFVIRKRPEFGTKRKSIIALERQLCDVVDLFVTKQQLEARKQPINSFIEN